MRAALLLPCAVLCTVTGLWHSGENSEHHLETAAEKTSSTTQAPGKATATTTANSSPEPTEQECLSLCKPVARNLSEVVPNVLVLGDEFSKGYFHIVQALLQQVASVQHVSLFDVAVEDGIPEGVCGTTVGVLDCVDTWLGNGTVWHVVVFNWGLHDIVPEMNTTAYVSRIKQIYVKIFAHVATAGAAVWLSTPPMPPGLTDKPNTAVVDINDAVEALWGNSSTPPEVDDLHKVIEHACHSNSTTRCYPDDCACEQLQDSSGKFNAFGNQFIGMHVAEVIRTYL